MGMEGDDQAQPDNMESQMPAPQTSSEMQSGAQGAQQLGSPATIQPPFPTEADTSHTSGTLPPPSTSKNSSVDSFAPSSKGATVPMEIDYSQSNLSSVTSAAGNSSDATTSSNIEQKQLPLDSTSSG